MAVGLGAVNDRSGVIIKISIKDSLGDPVTLTSGTWTLVTDEEAPVVINERQDVELPVRNGDGFYYVGLTNDDTAFADGATRYFILEGTYYNSLTASILDIKTWETFTITDVKFVV